MLCGCVVCDGAECSVCLLLLGLPPSYRNDDGLFLSVFGLEFAGERASIIY